MESPIQRRIPPKLASALALAALLTVLAPSATAQRTTHTARRFNSPTANHAFGQGAHPSAFRRSSPRTSLPFPFLGDFLSLEDLYSAGYPVASQPPVFLLQAARALSAPSDFPSQPRNEPATKTQPLMIERQNGHYVRLTTTPANGQPLSLENDKNPTPAATATLPPALLIFRDGHTEEVRDYSIADGTLYVRGDYYTDGYWNKKINLTALNVPQTLQANHERNVKFVLPSSPNEVITRP